jgi:hypothetical protein
MNDLFLLMIEQSITCQLSWIYQASFSAVDRTTRTPSLTHPLSRHQPTTTGLRSASTEWCTASIRR